MLTILVVRGAEYQAVCRGLDRATGAKPAIVSIPIGSQPLIRSLQKWQQEGKLSNDSQSKVLIMGLCGSLKPRYPVGEIVLYQDCQQLPANSENTAIAADCDRPLTAQIYSHLQSQVTLVRGLTSDRLIYSAAEKRDLGEHFGADAIDMEGFAALEFFRQAGVAVAMLRVVSDDCQHDLPNLNPAISPAGTLKTLPLAMAMLQQPLAATRLIRTSLKGLQVLERVTTLLFSSQKHQNLF
jgi:hypothetical protein